MSIVSFHSLSLSNLIRTKSKKFSKALSRLKKIAVLKFNSSFVVVVVVVVVVLFD